ncbi:MAG: hypothetical protein ABI651_10475 [Verrucomicrobiota bacterium]
MTIGYYAVSPEAGNDDDAKFSNSHCDPERGWVVATNRSTSAPHQAVLRIHALPLVLRTQPRSAK